MPRVNPTTRTLDDLTIGDLRRLIHSSLDEGLSLADALTALAESDAVAAAHERDVAAYQAHVARRAARAAGALASAAAAADKAARRHGDGARMAARQAARADAAEDFEGREPLLGFQEWVEAGRPEIHQVGAIRRAVEAVTSAVIA